MTVDVSVIILTYNQEKTIRRTIDSVLGQQTSCSYEIVIGDDGSKDNTRSVCEEYASKNHNKVRLNLHHENYGVVRNYEEALSRCRGKYCMVCAGDDWWSNPNKMQIQFNYMENHPDCVLCYGGFTEYYENNGVSIVRKPVLIKGPSFDFLLSTNPICAPTVCLRKSALDKVNFHRFIEQGFMVEDWPTWLALSKSGTIDTIEESLVTYSIAYGTLHNNNKFEIRKKYLDNFLKMRIYFAEEFGCLQEYESVIYDYYYLSVADTAIKYGKRMAALENYKRVNRKSTKVYAKIIMCSLPFCFTILNARKNKNM